MPSFNLGEAFRQSSAYLPAALLALLAVNILLGVIAVSVKVEQRRLEKRLRRLAELGSEQELAEWLERFRDINEAKHFMDKTSQRLEDLQQKWETSLCQLGIVRFNAFADVGSDLSFALALLDRRGDGFILTNLYSREESRVYIKPVQQGKASYRLSEEEEQAVAVALRRLPPDGKAGR